MAAIKNIIPTKALLVVLAAMVMIAASNNLREAGAYLETYPVAAALDAEKPISTGVFEYLTRDSVAHQNLSVMALIAIAADQPLREKLSTLIEARTLQEQALAISPADPYGWLRLSYLRRITQGNKQGAFEALKLSISAAPYEPRIMRDRALAWHELKSVQSDAEKNQQGELWRLAKRAEHAVK